MQFVFIYLVAFVVLFVNQSHFVFGGDSAEFSLVARTWSIAHPPGYPFYSLIINIVNRIIPFGSTPWKIATVSSVSTVLVSVLIYLLLRRLKISKSIALFSSLFYIVLFPVWEYSEIPEVFTLHNLLVIGVTYALILFDEKKRPAYFYLAAFLCGLCVAHHHIFVLFLPAWIYLLFRKRGRGNLFSDFVKKNYLASLVFFLAGAAFYLYAPIASFFSPPLDWENPKTLVGFIRLITRATYGTFKAYSGSSGNIVNQIYDIVSLFLFMIMDFRIIGIILVLVGALKSRLRKNPFYMFLMIALATHIFFLFYSNFLLVLPFTLAMYERFLIPLYLILVFFLAFGLQVTENYLINLGKKYKVRRSIKKMLQFSLPVFMTLYFLIVALQNYRTIRLIPQMDIFATYAKDLLDTPPKNSIFFVGADNSHFTTAYYHFGLGYRPDLKYVFINLLDRPFYREYARKMFPSLYIPKDYKDRSSLTEFLDKNKSMGLYFENPYGESWKPYGLLWKQYNTEEEAISDSAKLVSENRHLWRDVYTIPRLDQNLKKILHLNVVQGQYLYDYLNYSRLLFATNHIEEAREAVRNISAYQRNDVRMKFILINLYLYEKNCKEAGKIAQGAPLNDLMREPDILPSLKDYYIMCKPQEKDIILQIQNKENATKKAISDL